MPLSQQGAVPEPKNTLPAVASHFTALNLGSTHSVTWFVPSMHVGLITRAIRVTFDEGSPLTGPEWSRVRLEQRNEAEVCLLLTHLTQASSSMFHHNRR